jgi:hypothetical protein
VAEGLTPASDRFVIPPPEANIAKAVANLGSLEQLHGAEPLILLTLKASRSARDAWRVVASALGNERAAYPVLLDGGGAPHYPTGEITVRFVQTPSADEVSAFAGRLGLKLARANELAPKQFVFVPLAPAAEFLPDTVERLAAQSGVRSAWANTLSAYRRSDT